MKNIIKKLQEYNIKKGNELAFSHITNIKIENNKINNSLVSITYSELLEKVKIVAFNLLKYYKKGDRIILIYPSGIDFIIALLASFYTGIIAVPCNPPNLKRSHKIFSIMDNCQPEGILTTEFIYKKLLGKSEKIDSILKCFSSNETIQLDKYTESFGSIDIEDDDIALLQYTSGSTSDPKGVMVTHKNIISMCEYIHYVQETKPTDKSLTWLPNFHDMGLIEGLLKHLYLGTQCYIISPKDLFTKPELWLYFISKYKINITGSPNFLYDKCLERDINVDELDLSNLSVFYNGAEPIRHNTMWQFYKKFASTGLKAQAMYPVYGLAEGTLLVTSCFRDEIAKVVTFNENLLENELITFNQDIDTDGQLVVGCGRIHEKYCQVIIVDTHNKKLGENQVGEILIKGDSITAGYWCNEEATKANFQQYIDNDGPYFRTGDLGFIKDGELFINGRLKDIFIINGKNIYPQDIEYTIGQTQDCIEKNSIAVISIDNTNKNIVAVIELKRHHKNVDYEQLSKDVYHNVMSKHLISLSEIIFIRPLSIPKTSSGKIQRLRCLEIYNDNNLKRLYTKIMNKESIYQLLQEIDLIIDDLIQNNELIYNQDYLDKNLLEFGIDSIQLIQVAYTINERYNLNYSLYDFVNGVSVIELARDIKERISERPNNDNRSQNIMRRVQEEQGNLFPLSIGQEALYILQKTVNDKGILNIGKVIRIKGIIDDETVRSILNKLVMRFKMLSVKIRFKEGTIYQEYDMDIGQVVKVSKEPESIEKIKEHLADDFYQPFKLLDQHLVRIHMTYDQEGNTIIGFVFHHLIGDFWSLVLFLESFFALLTKKESTLSKNKSLEYKDYVERSNSNSQTKAFDRKVEGLKKLLGSQWTLPDLSTLNKLNARKNTFTGGSEKLIFSKEVSDRIDRFCKRKQMTKYVFLYGVFEILIHRYTQQNNVVIGTTFAGRDHVDYNGTFGFFTNMFPIKTEEFVPSISVDSHFDLIKNKIKEYLQYSNIRLSQIIRRFELKNKANNFSSFNIVFSFQNTINLEGQNISSLALVDRQYMLHIGKKEVEILPLEKRYTLFDIDFQLIFNGNTIEGDVVYNKDLYDSQTIQDMVDNYIALTENIIMKPEAKIVELDIINQMKKTKLIQAIKKSYRNSYKKEDGLLTRFSHYVKKYGDQIAVIDRNNHLSYTCLNKLSNRLASKIDTPSQSIGLFVDRNVYFTISLLASMKKEKCIVPIDTDFPIDRIKHIIKECSISYLMIEQKYVPLIEKIMCNDTRLSKLNYVICENILKEKSTDGDYDLIDTKSLDNYLYTVFTSGSTGMPKGVQVREKNLLPLLGWMKTDYKLSKDVRHIQCLSLRFDFGLKEMFSTLFYGCRLYFTDSYLVLNPEAFIECNEKYYINMFYMTPSMMDNIVDYKKFLKYTQRICLGGEILNKKLGKSIQKMVRDDCIITNGYGPTEASINCLMYDITKNTDIDTINSKSIPIGSSTGTAKLLVLDQNKCLVPRGAIGELYIAGICVSDGYINNHLLTDKKFIKLKDFVGMDVPDDYRVYRTGDYVREICPDVYEFIGRKDSQVKVRGVRIELSEIMNAIRKHEHIVDVVVDVTQRENNKSIIAYLVQEKNTILDDQEIRDYLKNSLPYYMIPSEFYRVDYIPLNKNGKKDIKKLNSLQNKENKIQSMIKEPINHDDIKKQKILEIWKKVLKVDFVIGYDDNLFEIGGHSLLVIKIHYHLEEEFQLQIPFSKLFELPTINTLGDYINSRLNKDIDVFSDINLQDNITNRKMLRDKNIIRNRGIKRWKN